MASPATAAFLAKWRHTQDVARRLLVQIDLTVPSSLTLKLAQADDVRLSGVWEAVIARAQFIEEPGAYLSPGFDPCSFAFSVFSRKSLSSGSTIPELWKTYRFVGATVTAWRWVKGLASGDRLQQFVGVIDDFDADDELVTLLCTQPRSSNRELPASRITVEKYPRSAHEVRGLPEPVIYGDCASQYMRGEEWLRANRDTKRQAFDIYGGLICGSRAIVVDPGMGSGTTNPKGRLLVAGHALQNVIEDGNLGNMGIRSGQEDRTALFDVPGGDVFNASTGSGVEIDDANAYGYLVLPMKALSTSANPAGERGLQVGQVQEFAYTDLNYNASKLEAKYQCLAMEPQGEISNIGIAVGYRTNDSADCGQEIVLVSTLSGQSWTHSGGIASTLVPDSKLVFVTGALTTYFTAEEIAAWDFSQGTLTARFKTGTWTGKTWRVYFLGLVIKYRPKQRVIAEAGREYQSVDRLFGPGSGDIIAQKLGLPRPAPAVTEIDRGSAFFAQPRGWKDDGSGTDTGVANALIQRAPDIARHALKTYGAVSGGDIETAASTFGSYADARAKLKDHTGQDMVFGRAFTELTNVHSALIDLAEQSASWFLRDPITNRFHWLPWTASPAVDYDLTIHPRNVIGRRLTVRGLGQTSILTGVRIGFLWDAARERLVSACGASANGSVSGYPFFDMRDQYLTVVAGVNDKLQWNITGPQTATLDPGDYTTESFRAHVRSKMGGGATQIEYGPTIRAADNDRIDFNDGATQVATIAPGAYGTFEALAAAVQTALNAVSSNWTCTFSRTTRKITIARSSGTAQLLWQSGAFRTTACPTLLGYQSAVDDTGASSYTADFEREEERFIIGRGGTVNATSTIDLLWETGSNGLNGTRTTCHELLGFSPLRDQTGGLSSWMAVCPKGNLEQTLKAARDAHGGRRELPIDADWIRSGFTAKATRDRLVALACRIPLVVSFQSQDVPDLQRGRVIGFDAAFDADQPLMVYGSNGSWAGKAFHVVSIRRATEAPWVDEITAVQAG